MSTMPNAHVLHPTIRQSVQTALHQLPSHTTRLNVRRDQCAEQAGLILISLLGADEAGDLTIDVRNEIDMAVRAAMLTGGLMKNLAINAPRMSQRVVPQVKARAFVGLRSVGSNQHGAQILRSSQHSPKTGYGFVFSGVGGALAMLSL